MGVQCARIGRRAAVLLAASSLACAGAAGAATVKVAPMKVASVKVASVKVAPGALKPIAKVDARFQSYNIETAEVIGGRFWAPYPKPGEAPIAGDPMTRMFRKREPIDLKSNQRLRLLAKALGPAYVRIGGAWANKAYFQDDDAPALAKAPAGYDGVLTRAEWAGVVDFAQATDAKIVTSFAVSAGPRDASGAWNPDQAKRLVAYTRSLGGSIYAAELINEPNVGPLVGLPNGYGPKDFARDEAIFREFIRTDAPQIKTVGPVSTGEAGYTLFPSMPGHMTTEAMLSAEPRATFDIFAYHFYGTNSQRCAMMGKNIGVKPEDALSEAWLARTDTAYDYYKALHDRFAPGTPIWITETAETACGGDVWAATFLDSFRYVDQMGRLAKRNVAAIFHNTLAASDYGLIDDTIWKPRPNYWAALLWRRTMGETVLDAGPIQPGLHVYAQCLRGKPGGVALVAINLDRSQSAALDLPVAAQRYTLTADELQSGTVKLNGRPLALTAGDQLPALTPAPTAKGRLALAPASITFLALPQAANPACK